MISDYWQIIDVTYLINTYREILKLRVLGELSLLANPFEAVDIEFSSEQNSEQFFGLHAQAQ